MYRSQYLSQAVVRLAEKSFLSTANLVKDFEQIHHFLSLEQKTQGCLILEAMHEELAPVSEKENERLRPLVVRGKRRAHEMYRLNSWMMDYLEEVKTPEVIALSKEYAIFQQKKEMALLKAAQRSNQRAEENIKYSLQLLFFCLF